MRGLLEPDHLLVILLVVFLLFGATKIPELAGGFGKGVREFRRGVHGGRDAASREPSPSEHAVVSGGRDERGSEGHAREPRRLLA